MGERNARNARPLAPATITTGHAVSKSHGERERDEPHRDVQPLAHDLGF